MGRPRKDTTIGPPVEQTTGEHVQTYGESQHHGEAGTNAPADEPKKSARGPSVPFQMVTRRRGAQARISGGSQDHTVGSEEHGEDHSVADSSVIESARRESEPPAEEPVTAASERAVSPHDPEETPRRSSRVPVKTPAKRGPKPRVQSRIVVLRLRPELLKKFETSSTEVKDTPAEETPSSAPRRKRAKQVAKEPPVTPTTPQPAAITASQEKPAAAPEVVEGSTPRQKRSRKAKEARPSIIDDDFDDFSDLEAEEEEERPIKRRRYTKKQSEGKIAQPVAETVPVTTVQNEAPELTITEAPTSVPTPPIVTPATPVPVDQQGSPQSAVDSTPPSQPQIKGSPATEEPQQKRRGRPPKAELLRRRGPRPQVPPSAALESAPLPENFRSRLPPGYSIEDFINLAKHSRDLGLKAKKRQLRRSIKRGYRVERRVTKEWVAQRQEKLVQHTKKLAPWLLRANARSYDTAIDIVQASTDEVLENGFGVELWRKAKEEANEYQSTKISQAERQRDFQIKQAGIHLGYTLGQSRHQLLAEIMGVLEKEDMQRVGLQNIMMDYCLANQELVDDLVATCEEDGRDVGKAILELILHEKKRTINRMMDRVDNIRGLGAPPFEFAESKTWTTEDVAMLDSRNVQEDEAEEEPDEMEDVQDSTAQQDKEERERKEFDQFIEDSLTGVAHEMEMEEIEKARESEKQEMIQRLALLADTAAEASPIHETIEVLSTEPKPKMSLQGEREVPNWPFTNGESVDISKDGFKEPSREDNAAPSVEPAPKFEENIELPIASPSPRPSFGGVSSSIDGRSNRGLTEERGEPGFALSGPTTGILSRASRTQSAEPGFALSGPSIPLELLNSSPSNSDHEVRSRFTSSSESRRRTEARIFPRIDGPVFSPLQTHHHFMPGVSPPPPLSAGSSAPSLPPPAAVPSPGRVVLPSPVPSQRFPVAYQAVPQQSPSPPVTSVFNPINSDQSSTQRFRSQGPP